VAKVHPGATLTPHFREFLPAWLARQPWYRGRGIPSLAPVGSFRFEDPAGAVGIETHLVTDGAVVYQVPLTYRGAPMVTGPMVSGPAVSGPADGGRAEDSLVATAEHSVLGTRWIYDGEADPVWRGEVLRLVRTGGVSEPGGKRGAAPAEARGRPLSAGQLAAGPLNVELRRVLVPGHPAVDVDAAGLVMGSWHPGGPGTEAVTGCLAVVRAVSGDRAHHPAAT
jgi:hypothetical protein